MNSCVPAYGPPLVNKKKEKMKAGRTPLHTWQAPISVMETCVFLQCSDYRQSPQYDILASQTSHLQSNYPQVWVHTGDNPEAFWV